MSFPSPADEYMESALDLNTHLVQHPSATFFFEVKSNILLAHNIHPKDVLIVDRSLNPRPKDMIIATQHNKLTCFSYEKATLSRSQDNVEDTFIWGVVTYIIHACR